MRCLIVSDCASAPTMVEAIHDLGHAANLAPSSALAKAHLRLGGIDVLITDNSLSDERIGEVARLCQSLCPDAHIMNISPSETMRSTSLPDHLVRLLASPAIFAAPDRARSITAAMSWMG